MVTQGLQRQPQSGPGILFDENQYKEFFTRLTGKTPYPYQTELARKLSEGKSVILRAPTGSGKTWATVAPFIYSCINHNRFADRLLYALPLRSLASNLHSTTIEKLKTLSEFKGRVCHSARNRRYRQDDPFYLGLQMGGQQDDPFFEGDIVFTTIDQLLSAYLFSPVSLPERVGNIGAGALIGSLLVFDEVHLLDPERSLATTIEMLDRLKGFSQFVLMTATVPDSVMRWLENTLEAASVSLSDEEVRELPSHASKKRSFEWRSSPLSADDILKEHTDRTIVIVNTVGRAQELFRGVCEKVKGQSCVPQVFLLHSRFYPQDRKSWESKLADYFGPDASLSNAILISTQVVEAGIDISADVLLTELAPLNSLLQRAGRVARYVDRNTGRLLVFELPKTDAGRTRLGPYRDDPELIAETQKLLSEKGKLISLDYLQELEWLKRIHDVSDLEDLKPLNSLHTHRQHVLNAMEGLDGAACSRLVRDASSVNVVLADRPENLSFTARKWPELLSVPRTSLLKLKEACAKAGSVEWVLKVPEEIKSESNQTLNFEWRTLKNPAAVAWLVAVNPAYARYSEQVGLEFDKSSDGIPEVRYKLSPPLPRYSYQKESFVVHAKRVTSRGEQILMQCRHLFERLSRQYESFNLQDVFLLTCALHDTGKLQIEWQNKAQRWQQHIDTKLASEYKHEPLAHTNFDPDRDHGEQWPKFPPHAACSGFAVLPYFLKHFSEEVALLLCTAITRHHGTHTKELGDFELVPETEAILEQSLPRSVPQHISVKSKPEQIDLECFSKEYLLHFNEKDNQQWWPLYASLIRVLRLADQGSFKD